MQWCPHTCHVRGTRSLCTGWWTTEGENREVSKVVCELCVIHPHLDLPPKDAGLQHNWPFVDVKFAWTLDTSRIFSPTND